MNFLKTILHKLNIFKIITYNVFKKYKPLYLTSIFLLIFFSVMLYGLSFENVKGNTQAIITTYLIVSLSVSIIIFVFIIGFPIHYIDEYKLYKQKQYQKYYDDLKLYLTTRILTLGYKDYITFLYVSKELYFINPYNNIHDLYNYVFIIDEHRLGKSAGVYKLSEEIIMNVNNFFEYEI